MAQMYGSAFIYVCIKNMHTTQTDRHIPGTYTYIYTDTLTPTGMYVHRTASHQLKFNLSEQPLLQSWFPPSLKTTPHLGSLYFLQARWHAQQEPPSDLLHQSGGPPAPGVRPCWQLKVVVQREGQEQGNSFSFAHHLSPETPGSGASGVRQGLYETLKGFLSHEPAQSL